jgi:hypothetical protein
MASHGAVAVRFKLDIPVLIVVFFDNKRSASVLGVALCIADIKHFVQLNRWLIRRLELLNLLKKTASLVETGSGFRGTHRIETLDCLND